MKYASQESFNAANVFGLGEPNDAFAQYFTGQSFLNALTDSANGEFVLQNSTPPSVNSVG